MTITEILPGIWHWTAPHPNLDGVHVSSYWLEPGGVLIDPQLPEEGIGWFEQRPRRPSAIVLCNRHHYRSSGELSRHFGIAVHVPAAGMHAFGGDRPAVAYEPGDSLPGGLEAFSRLLDRYQFEHLLLAHGLPLIGDGRTQLEQFVQAGGRTADDAFG